MSALQAELLGDEGVRQECAVLPRRSAAHGEHARYLQAFSELCIAATAAFVGVAAAQSGWLGPLSVPIILFGGLSLVGVRDLFQTRHAVLRNYPISAHLRFILEELRPQMRQYFFESEKDGLSVTALSVTA